MNSFNACACMKTCKINRTLTYDNTTMLTFTISYPKIYLQNNEPVQVSINAQIQKQVNTFYQHASGELYQQAIAYYKDTLEQGFPFHPYDAVLKYETTYNQNCYLSVYREQYEYTGGAHGSTVRSSDTWNLSNGKNVPLSCLFPAGQDYCALLTEQIIKQADKQYQQNPGIYFENYRELIVKNFNKESYYLTCCGVAIYYQQYDIAPYSTGIVVFIIPYAVVGWYPQCFHSME
ncbi:MULTISPECIES: DUF3298 and DUF4163 domain-containing protein [Caproicibacterium]|uniref:DUF4163 domain-containing protein n=1 Tax=Caproicibacterium lactatifermentans TaxID=2666138 RepID=A0A859DMY7_9FIRM|nr:DUF3298 and DUF4163 domain-containing protein [Caproicibacterium lactatifermentans]ARP50907.1 hypothetical protein B6259_08540 [Ruminococcaceae bacterium CPB6]QKN23367.1 DUF4163 domain-containing protein [Caproicibacterium lactatifermentans]QKO29955.1 DUF4163 domain-containing protein [Caproicibacterium lactatifermentans]